MAQQTINVGTAPNDGTGTPLRTAFQYTNSNFSELYTAVGPSGNNIVVPGTATITGDLTVDTSTLKVDSANDVVGIGTASPNGWGAKLVSLRSTTGISYTGVWNDGTNNPRLEISHTSTGSVLNATSSSGGAYSRLRLQVAGADQYQIDALGIFTWYDGAGGTRMTLNSTGLGVGASPGYKLHVGGYSSANIAPDAALVRSSSGTTIQSGPNLLFSDGTSVNNVVLQNTQGRFGIWNYGAGVWNERLSVDANGNCGIGVTPSAWATSASRKAIQLSTAGSISAQDTGTAPYTFVASNWVSTATGDQYILGSAAPATLYRQFNGTHSWFNAPSGTGALTFTQSMALDASGNLGIGVTPSAWATGTYKSLQIGQSSSISAGVASELVVVGSNCYFDTTDSRWERITSGYTSQYYQTGGTHVWRIGGTAGANTDCSFTSAMTLDTSGNLLVGKSVSLFSTVGVEASGTGFISATNSASTNASTNLSVYSTGAAAFRFYVGLGGTVYATNTTISAISDQRLKENVQDIDVGLGAILALKPRKFDWKAGKGKDIKGDRGFIAQEFEQVFPQLVDEWKDEAPEGEAPYKSVRQDLIPVLVKAIQELAAEVNALKNA